MIGKRLLLNAGLIGLAALGSGSGAVLGTAVLTGPAAAQSMRDVETPAEFPPASYEGKQYVDSRGCVYVRAGVDGNVTWVPRVTRSREAVCGFTPTLGAEARSEMAASETPPPAENALRIEPAPAAEAQATAERQTTQAQAAARPAPRPEPRPAAPMATVATTATKPAPRAKTQPAAPRRRVEERPAEERIVKAPVRRVVTVADGEIRAAAGSGIASYGRCADGTPVTGIRCGVGTAAQATYVSRGNSGVHQAPTQRVPRTTLVEAQPGSVSPRATIVPRHVYHPPEPASAQISVPDGYRPAWTDDRLNERRAYQTLNGKAEMELIWTRTVPRRLVDRVSGDDVTSDYPRLFYPFTDYETQRTYLAAEDEYRVLVGQRSGTVRLVEKAAPVISSRSVSAAQAPKPAEAQAARKAPVARSAPAAPRAEATGAAQYVQVGAFGVAANAQGSLRRLRGAGLPAVARPMRSGGKVLQVVMAGPFTSSSAAQAALGKARAAGFGEAFLR